ncbi:MAG: lipoyl(octanoyl) transferase [Halanaerobiales bacterium]|nr:lipoyl(octanoyl) transferase [Halanaerobiales bacterium]
MMNLQVVLAGLIDYQEALKIQKRLLQLRQAGKIQDILLLLEHPPVITLGKRGKDTNILMPEDLLKSKGIKIYRIDRGGDVTYHGPGQIVGYPIMDLKNHGKDIRKFVRNIEEVFIRLLKEEYNITAGRDPEHIGVWVGEEKITAIGLSIKRWVSMHGFAFNVNTNLDHFNLINPCGIIDKGVTSLEKIVGHPLNMDKVIDQVIKYISRIFGVEVQISKEALKNNYDLLRGDDDERE